VIDMLTYQLQRRVYRSDGPLSFPNDVEIEISLEPSELFGVGNKLTTITVPGHETKISFNPHTGKTGVIPTYLFESIEVVFEWEGENVQLEMRGNKLYATCKCKDLDELNGYVTALHYIVPILLNIEFKQPTVVISTQGRVGDLFFRWELANLKSKFDVATKESQEKLVIDSFKKLSLVCDLPNRRLAAALYYFYTAKRLVEAGNSPYEFMSEVVLNYSKVLEVLFAHSEKTRDDVKNELLTSFGYNENEFDLKFKPIMLLRNEFDVGHVSIELFDQEQLSTLYKYLEFTEADLRELLKRVISKVGEGNYCLKRNSDLKDMDKQKIMNRLIKTFEERARQNS
jgi:hypothetical protein